MDLLQSCSKAARHTIWIGASVVAPRRRLCMKDRTKRPGSGATSKVLYERSYKTAGNRRHVESFVRKIVQNGREAASRRKFCTKDRTKRSRIGATSKVLYERSYKTAGNRRHVEGFVRKIVQNGRESAPGRRFCTKDRTKRSRSGARSKVLYERSYKTAEKRRHVEGFVRKIVQNDRESAPRRRFCTKDRTKRPGSGARSKVLYETSYNSVEVGGRRYG